MKIEPVKISQMAKVKASSDEAGISLRFLGNVATNTYLDDIMRAESPKEYFFKWIACVLHEWLASFYQADPSSEEKIEEPQGYTKTVILDIGKGGIVVKHKTSLAAKEAEFYKEDEHQSPETYDFAWSDLRAIELYRDVGRLEVSGSPMVTVYTINGRQKRYLWEKPNGEPMLKAYTLYVWVPKNHHDAIIDAIQKNAPR